MKSAMQLFNAICPLGHDSKPNIVNVEKFKTELEAGIGGYWCYQCTLNYSLPKDDANALAFVRAHEKQ